VVATREDGVFEVNIIEGNKLKTNKLERLKVCQNCLDRIKWQGFDYSLPHNTKNNIRDKFELAEYFIKYEKALIIEKPSDTDKSAPLNIYNKDAFNQVSEIVKKDKNYKCDKCNIDLSKDKKYLHAHHKNGQKSDNAYANISILCIKCHEQEFRHSHMKRLPEYNEFIRRYGGA
jgi:hypothetical protein